MFSRNAVWGVIWLIIAFCFFGLGIIVGLVAFKVSNQSESIYCKSIIALGRKLLLNRLKIRNTSFPFLAVVPFHYLAPLGVFG
jgi:hypothetical protein